MGFIQYHITFRNAGHTVIGTMAFDWSTPTDTPLVFGAQTQWQMMTAGVAERAIITTVGEVMARIGVGESGTSFADNRFTAGNADVTTPIAFGITFAANPLIINPLLGFNDAFVTGESRSAIPAPTPANVNVRNFFNFLNWFFYHPVTNLRTPLPASGSIQINATANIVLHANIQAIPLRVAIMSDETATATVLRYETFTFEDLDEYITEGTSFLRLNMVGGGIIDLTTQFTTFGCVINFIGAGPDPTNPPGDIPARPMAWPDEYDILPRHVSHNQIVIRLMVNPMA